MNPAIFTSYDENGKILMTGRAGNPEEQGPHVFLGAAFDGDLFYFLDHVPTPRPQPSISLSRATITADGQDEVMLQGVPAGSIVKFGGEAFSAEGGDIAITTEAVGMHTVVVEPFPAKRWSGVFHATEN